MSFLFTLIASTQRDGPIAGELTVILVAFIETLPGKLLLYSLFSSCSHKDIKIPYFNLSLSLRYW